MKNMKKLFFICMTTGVVPLSYAKQIDSQDEAMESFGQEETSQVDSVVDITPDKGPELALPVMPTPPAEIKASSVQQLPSGAHGASRAFIKRPSEVSQEVKEAADQLPTNRAESRKPGKVPFHQMTQKDQILVLKHKLDKLRDQLHQVRAKMHKMKEKFAEQIEQISGSTHESEQEIKAIKKRDVYQKEKEE